MGIRPSEVESWVNPRWTNLMGRTVELNVYTYI
jgi:hypothetical protein